ncbi:ABC transporter substrate-binding protein [Streptomyces halobius]|uniref:ABC transporter substrate-binding protein n=1 Tax=Streptomyces halobius TaxID=2879846 RepID=A0ABY4M5L3_9ACTN|nr:ABC transporter substrate-binding protein [Streptomyces halobius]UQA92473.1 ABC transporter substrate-binding protein [Streptomyces halobius]
MSAVRFRLLAAAVTLPVLIAALGACGYGSKAKKDTAGGVAPKGAKVDGLDQVRIGLFGNTTHATPLIGLQKGFFQKELGGTEVKPSVFNAGPAEIEALNSGAIDIGWIGPSPSINGFAKSHGRSLKIISGSASGGVSLVVNPEKIKSLDDLKGKTIATPQLGNTQDVALLHYLAGRGYKVDATTGTGEVTVQRTDNKVMPTAFKQGSIDAAWVPEPTASKLVAAGGKALLDETKLWKNGKFVITHVIVSQQFLKEHPKAVEAVLRGSVKTNAWIRSRPAEAQNALNDKLADSKIAGQSLPPDVIAPAFKNIEVTDDPLAATLQKQTDYAVQAGLLAKPDLKGIYDLTLLNKVLKAEGRPQVDDAGLGSE